MWCEGINWNKADREQWRAAQLHFLNTRNCRLNSSLSPALPPCNWSHQKSLEPLERSERQSVPCPSSHPIPSSVTGLTLKGLTEVSRDSLEFDDLKTCWSLTKVGATDRELLVTAVAWSLNAEFSHYCPSAVSSACQANWLLNGHKLFSIFTTSLARVLVSRS